MFYHLAVLYLKKNPKESISFEDFKDFYEFASNKFYKDAVDFDKLSKKEQKTHEKTLKKMKDDIKKFDTYWEFSKMNFVNGNTLNINRDKQTISLNPEVDPNWIFIGEKDQAEFDKVFANYQELKELLEKGF